MTDTEALLARMHEADADVQTAVGAALPALARAADAIASRLDAGGRWIYTGAGTSGRLGALDAAELPPTFGTDPALVVALLAGGKDAMFEAVEGAEDDADAGAFDLLRAGLTGRDAVVGIAASGGTPYVRGALKEARARGALTVSVVCRPGTPLLAEAEIGILLDTGREVLAESSRLKAGTRAEDRAEHALDGRHGEARPRLRGRDGRDAADERKAPEAGKANRGAAGRNVRRDRRGIS